MRLPTCGASWHGFPASSLALLRENADEPFFLWLHYFDPHEPSRPRGRFRKGLPLYHAVIRRVDRHVGLLLDGFTRCSRAP